MIKIKVRGMEADVILANVHPEIRPIRGHIFVRPSQLNVAGHLDMTQREETLDYLTNTLFSKYIQSFKRLDLSPNERAMLDGQQLPVNYLRIKPPKQAYKPDELVMSSSPSGFVDRWKPDEDSNDEEQEPFGGGA